MKRKINKTKVLHNRRHSDRYTWKYKALVLSGEVCSKVIVSYEILQFLSQHIG